MSWQRSEHCAIVNCERNGQYVLESALKDLIANGIIERQSSDEILLRVEYSLSERGKSEVPILQNICQ